MSSARERLHLTTTRHPRVVMHQVQSPENLGAAARLMSNFGYTDLTLSCPVTRDWQSAAPMARGSPLLKTLRVVETLSEALTDCVYVCGTTSRTALYGREPLTPEVASAQIQHHQSRGPVAIVFGGERRGLSDDELAHCQDVVVIPTDEAQPSMNLAQAMAVMLYLCRDDVPRTSPASRVPVQGASHQLTERLQALMQKVLTQVDFLNTQSPKLILGELVRSLARSDLTEREAQLWLTAFKQLDRCLPKT